jgi:hypothetical protein
VAAGADGIELAPAGQSVIWLTQRGHIDVPDRFREVRASLTSIFDVLGGNLEAQSAKRSTPLPGDLLHVATGTLIEVDEYQHFTSFRLMTLDLYPTGYPLGFDPDRYSDLCDKWKVRADRYRAFKAAPGFGPGGRQRQRAYNDALRDLVAPLMGAGLIRVDAVEGDGEAAYQRSRDRLHAALG